MKKISSSYELSVSEENQPIVLLVARKLGYYDGSPQTPEKVIVDYLNQSHDELRALVSRTVSEYYGIYQKDIADTVMAQYDASVISSVTIE